MQNKINQLLDSYNNGNFSQLRDQLKKVSVKKLMEAYWNHCQLTQDDLITLLKYKTGVK